MSLFGAMMGDVDEDPFFGVHNRAMSQMNSMVNSLFADPFGMGMGGMPGFPSLMGGPMMPGMGQMVPRRQRGRGGDHMMPFGGFPNAMGDMFGGAQHNLGDCHSFSSSTMVSMTTGPDGRPRVYQASSSTRTAPGGVRETKKAVADSRSGTKKMAIGHHIGDRAHIVEREQNVYSGEQEERQELINLEEGHSDDNPRYKVETADDFNREWENRTRRAMGGVAIEDVTDRPSAYQPRERPQLLALPSSGSSSSRSRSRAHPTTSTTSSSAVSHERPHKRVHGADGSSSRKASKQHRTRRE